MIAILSILQIFLVLILTLLVFMQKSESDGVANLVSQGTGGHALISREASVSLIVKLTMCIAIAFMANSLVLSKLAYNKSMESKILIDNIQKDSETPLRDLKQDKQQLKTIPIPKKSEQHSTTVTTNETGISPKIEQ